MLLRDYFNGLFCPTKLLNREPKTKCGYRTSIKHLEEFLGRDANVEDLNDLIISQHLGRMIEKGASLGTVSKERTHLTAMANFAAKKRLLTEFVDIAPIRVPERIPECWTHDELARLIKACRTAGGCIAGIPSSSWFLSVHLAIFDTGERVGAMLRCKWSDLNGDNLHVRAEYRKGKIRDRLYPLSEDTVECINRIRHPDRDLIWPIDFSTSTLYDRYKKLLQQAGLPDNRMTKFHRMRKTVATYLQAAGINPQTQLDHSSSRTTAKYIDQRMLRQTAPRDVLDRLMD